MNVLEALLHPDRDEDVDRAGVVHAANLLEVGEFQLLQLAFDEWYGREMYDSEKELFFHHVFLEKSTPSFLRHYARKIVLKDNRGELRSRARGYHRYDPEVFTCSVPSGAFHFLGVATLLIGMLFGSLVVANHTVERVGSCTDPLPPCLTEQDLGDFHGKKMSPG